MEKAQDMCRALRNNGYLVPLEVMQGAMEEAKVGDTTLNIDMAGAMEKITPEMMDVTRDLMIEALTRQLSTIKHAKEQSGHLADLSNDGTPGMWGQFSATSGPWKDQARELFQTDRPKAIQHLDTSHHVSAMRQDGMPYRVATFQHARDAAFVEALVNAYRAGLLVPVEVTDENREMIADVLAEALGDAMDCDRCWSAWGVNTMSADDFHVIAEDPDRLHELVDAVLGVILKINEPAETDAEKEQGIKDAVQMVDNLATHGVIDPDTLPGQASDPDKRPMDCRERQREEGRAYPKSGCPACGANLATGLSCKHDGAAT